jgi:hypothetical protein
MQPLFGALLYESIVKGKTHAIGTQQNPSTFPPLARYMTGGADYLVERSHDHCSSPIRRIPLARRS